MSRMLKVDKDFERKVEDARQAHDWVEVERLYWQYGGYLELIDYKSKVRVTSWERRLEWPRSLVSEPCSLHPGVMIGDYYTECFICASIARREAENLPDPEPEKPFGHNAVWGDFVDGDHARFCVDVLKRDPQTLQPLTFEQYCWWATKLVLEKKVNKRVFIYQYI